MNTDEVKNAAAKQAAAFGIGAAVGTLTKHAAKQAPGAHRSLAMQIGSAVGAAAAGGAGLSGSLAAGTAVVAAKVAAAVAIGAAAAPFVAIAGSGYCLYRLFRKP